MNINSQFVLCRMKHIILFPLQCLVQDDSDSTSEDQQQQQDLLRQKLTKRANINFKEDLAAAVGGVKNPVNQIQHFDFNGDPGDFDDEDDESLWMTSTQFSQMLDKQEVLENLGYSKVMKLKSPAQIKGTAKKIMKNNKSDIIRPSNMAMSASFLDQNAQVPLGKLRKVCIFF